jgi:uncharacterized protein
MEFEFGPAKSVANKAKHGIEFNDAIELWNDPDRIEVPAQTADEPRSVVIGKIAGKHWCAVITYRADRVRIVSVRRSRVEEVRLYEGEGE